jgi:hypothetical protein
MTNEVVRIEQSEPTTLPEVGSFTFTANMLVIDSQESYEHAEEQLAIVKTMRNGTEAEREKAVGPINKAKAVIQGWFKPVIDDCDAAEKIIKDAILAYQKEQRALADLKQAAADKATRELRERQEAQAKKAEKFGNTELAATIRQGSAMVTAPVVTSTFTPVKGSVTKKKWKARLDVRPSIDAPGDTPDQAMLKIVNFVSANPDYLYLIMLDWTRANGLATMQESRLCVPGLVAYEEETLAKSVK